METDRGIMRETVAAFLTGAAAVAGTLVVYQLGEPSSRLRLALDELRDRAGEIRHLIQEAWIEHVVNDLIEGSD